MARVRRLVVWTVIVWAAATPARAATVSEWLTGVETAASAAGLLMPGSVAKRAFDDAKRALTEADVLDEEIAAFVSRYTRPDAMALAHRSQKRFDAGVSPAVTTVKQLFTLLPAAAQTAEPLRSVALELQTAETASSMNWDFEILRRLERKYGPGSARLNGAEVLLSYALQGTSAFGIDSTTRYPGPFEPVLAYSVAYLTRSEESMRVVSVAELGLRRYIFKDGWGGGGRLGFIRPRYLSAGMSLSGETDEPLSFRGDTRFGAFFGWGELKVAYLGGANKRVLFTQQFQIIPWVF
jgi:hypothetical protein